MKIEWLKTLADVQRYGSFTAVGRRRNCSSMAISKQITALEQRVGEALLNRSTRQPTLTEAGETLLSRSQMLLAEHDALTDWLEDRQGEPKGTLRVLVFEEVVQRFTLTPWLSEFLTLYPDINVEFIMGNGLSDVESLKVDIYWGVSQYLGMIMPGLKRRLLIHSNFGIYASPDYLARYGTPKSPEDLDGHFVIGNSHNEPDNSLIVAGGRDFDEHGLQGIYLKTKVVSGVNHVELAEQGLGLVNNASLVYDYLKTQRSVNLVPVLEDYWIGGIEVFAYYHQTKLEQPKVRAFLDFFYSKRAEWNREQDR